MLTLSVVFESHKTNFEESECVYNTATKNNLPDEFAKKFLNRKQEGEKRLNEFISDMILGNISL